MRTESEQAGLFKALIQSHTNELNVHMPVVVTAVNADQTVDVKIAIQKPRTLADGNRGNETSEVISSVPVVLPSCSGFSIDIPITVGCKGYVHFSDLDHDNFFLGNVDADGIAEAYTSRHHAFNDVVFEPAFNGSLIDTDCLQLRSNNVTLKICHNGFDVEFNGRSLIQDMQRAASARNGAFLNGWKPA